MYIHVHTHYMDVWSEKKLHSSTKSRQFPVSWFKSFWSWLATTCWSQSFLLRHGFFHVPAGSLRRPRLEGKDASSLCLHFKLWDAGNHQEKNKSCLTNC